MTHALTVENRVRHFELRVSARSVGELAGRISRPAVSRHLRLLEDAGLVKARRDGTCNVNSVRMQGFLCVRAFLDESWDAALARSLSQKCLSR